MPGSRNDPRPSPFSHEWVELARELSVSELRRLVAFYNRGIRSGLSATSPRRVLEILRGERRRRRLLVSQITRSVIRPTAPAADPPSLN
jgi:hypothetical protein